MYSSPSIIRMIRSRRMRWVGLVLLVAGNCGRARGVKPSLAGPGRSLSSVGTTSLECSVLECGQMYSTVRCVAGLRGQCFLLGQ
jgi:hypothetical protein